MSGRKITYLKVFRRPSLLCSFASVFFVIILFEPAAQKGIAEDEILPSLNYWNLRGQLIRGGPLRDALDISPAQIKALRSLAFTPEMNQKFSRKVSLSDPFGRHKALLLVDDQVESMLSEILFPEQLSQLRKCAMDVRFTSGVEAFRDQEVLSHFEIAGEVQSLKKDIDRIAAERGKVVKGYKVRAAENVLKLLPKENLDRFHVYAGIGFLSELRESDLSLDQGKAPESPLIRSVTVARWLLIYEDLRKACKLSPKQRRQIESVVKEYDKSLRRISPGAGVSISQLMQESSSKVIMQTKKVLSSEQWEYLRVHFASTEFLADMEKTFENPDVLKFIGLDLEQLKTVRLAIQDEKEKLASLEARIYREQFEEIVGMIQDEKKRDSIRKLFAGCWRN